MRRITILLLTLCLNQLSAQSTIKVMFYNLLYYPSAPPFNRDEILKDILEGYQPDLFLVCELEDEEGANNILDVSLNGIGKNYQKAIYTPNQSSDNSILEQFIYYNSDYFILENQQIVQTDYRDINHYTFILKTANQLTSPIRLEVFVAHFKAQQGAANEQLRLQMATQFSAALSNLAPNSMVLFGGDLNLYTTTEAAYQKILDPSNAILIKDILNLNNDIQNWHNAAGWVGVHTQSTRASNGPFGNFGAGGGLDDRFDFIMLSENMLSEADIQYKTDTYQSYGNNNNCFNTSIDGANCSGQFSQELRTDLYNMSDHLPVVLELETAEIISSTAAINHQASVYFPSGNIVQNQLEVHFDEQLIGNNIYIYNHLGQVVYTSKINSTDTLLHLSNLIDGIYFFKIERINGVQKIVKIN